MEAFDKHYKYYNKYTPNDIFYGLGIENEFYFMFDKKIETTVNEIKHNHLKERYSANNYIFFKKSELEKFYDNVKSPVELPVYMNSHALTKCDIDEEHTMLYTVNKKPNPKFNGKTVFDILKEKSDIIKNMYLKEFMFDTNSIEVISVNFYKTTVKKCINELIENKQKLLNEFKRVFKEEKIHTKYGELMFPPHNYGLVKYTTNINNVSTCNSGTYHINITLPTKLGIDGKILDENTFREIHKNAIRSIQWIEPLLIACYGTPDIFSIYNDKFSKCSLRCALSRLISLGTYDTNKMISGRLADEYICKGKKDLWYNKYHSESGYMPPEIIGYDINYNKYKNHGIEVRIFDYFPEEYLEDVINILLLVCDYSLEKKLGSNPSSLALPEKRQEHSSSSLALSENKIIDPLGNIWNETMCSCIKDGSNVILNDDYVKSLEHVFNLKIIDKSVVSVLQNISDTLFKNKKSEFITNISPNMKQPVIINYNNIANGIHKKLMLMTG
jgi:hypothetical protein